MMPPVKMADLEAWLAQRKFPIGFNFEAAAKFWVPELTCSGKPIHYTHKDRSWDAFTVFRGHKVMSMGSTETMAWAKALYIINKCMANLI